MFARLRASNILIKFLGVGFIVLGFIRLTSLYNTTSSILLSFSLTAFFLLLSDLAQFASENYEKTEKNENNKKDNIILSIITVLHTILIALSAISLIVIPYIQLSNYIDNSILIAINDMLTLFGLGVAISLIGLKSERTQDKDIKEHIKNSISKTIENIDIKLIVQDEIKNMNMEDRVKLLTNKYNDDNIDINKKINNNENQ